MEWVEKDHPEIRPDLSDAELNNMDLSEVQMSDVELSNVDLSGSSMDAAFFVGSTLTSAKFKERFPRISSY